MRGTEKGKQSFNSELYVKILQCSLVTDFCVSINKEQFSLLC